jgi:GT2 family glycosyltransferase
MGLDVTVVMTIRETFSTTITSLNSILENTSEDVRIIVVSSAFPGDVLSQIEELAKDNPIDIVRVDNYQTPTQARNEALTHVTTRYVAFVDNDVMVKPNWLSALVTCADEEDAAMVVPLIYERYPLWKYIHIAGGESAILETENGERVCHQLPYYMHHDNEADPKTFERCESTLVEFHTVLVEMKFLTDVGGMDAEIRCMFEEWDICIQAMRLNRKIFFEPKSEIAYLAPRNPNSDDLRYFDLRWSDKWVNESVQRMIEKYDLTPNTGNLKAGRTFVKDHRLHKHFKIRNQLRGVLGHKVSDVFMNRVVAYWDKVTNDALVRDDYEEWKSYTENANQ